MKLSRTTARRLTTGHLSTALAGGALVGLGTTGAHADSSSPDAGGYRFVDSTEPGGPAAGPFTPLYESPTATDIGNHCDDCVTPVSLPFPIDFYTHRGVTDVNVSSNGNIQFDTDSDGWYPEQPPTIRYGSVIEPLQTDLRTDRGGRILSDVSGTAPHRQFTLEWDAQNYRGDNEFFQVVFNEGSPHFSFRYLDVTLGMGHVVAIQGGDGADGTFTSYNAKPGRDVSSGLAIDFVAPNTAVALSGSPQSTVLGQRATLTAHVARTDGATGVPSGTVSFGEGDTTYGTVPVNAKGNAVLRTTGLAVGGHAIVARYSGNGGNADPSSSAYLSYVVAPAPTTLTLGDSGSVAYGKRIYASVHVTKPAAGAPHGHVVWYDGEDQIAQTDLTNSYASLPPQALEPGSHSLTAVFESTDERHEQSSAHSDLTVTKASTGTTLTATPNPVVSGKRTLLVARVKPATKGAPLTGQVVFRDAGSVIGTATLGANEQARLSWTATPAGTHQLTAEYAGDARYSGSASPATDISVQ